MEKDNGVSYTRIYLVRHGETEYNRTGRFQGRNDQPLNERGRQQALALARALQDKKFIAIYTSPLPRSLETAGFIRAYHPNVPLIEEPNFMEMDLGEFEGLDWRQWMEQNQDFVKAWSQNPASIRIPGGENLQEVQNRAVETLTRISARYDPGSTLLICSHSFVLSTILCQAQQIPLDRFREVKKETASYSVLSLIGGRFHPEFINERSHLAKLPDPR